jgi:bacillithiol biosynthesis deacetylase BshB1
MHKLDILAFGAHPDDVELGCAGTLLGAIAEGKKVGVIDLTKGELGTRGTISQRLSESQLASEVLGLSIRENLGMADGFFINNKEHQLIIIETIRRFQPSIIFCNAPEDRHPDHGRAASLVAESAFPAPMICYRGESN